MFNHINGLKYRWKEGIITAVYDKVIPLNNLNTQQMIIDKFEEDVGLFTTNTAFDGMDSANVISVMTTGQPI